LTGTLARLGESESTAPTPTPAEPTYTADGTIKKIDGDRWAIAADAIPALGMGAMTMTFVRHASASDAIAPGQRVRFSFFRNADGDFEIKTVTPIDSKPAAPRSGGAS
jgi:Cu(I)/Ag(I) efflux system membrane fusion protein